MRLPRPLYEALPYLYMTIGLSAVATSFLWRKTGWSDVLSAFGMVAVVIGLTLVLKRRDYRLQRRHYGAAFDDDQ